MELVAAEDQSVIDGVPHQVDAGPHDEYDDAEVHHGARKGLGGALHQLHTKQPVRGRGAKSGPSAPHPTPNSIKQKRETFCPFLSQEESNSHKNSQKLFLR